MQEKICQFIGAASSWGAKIGTCEDGPEVLRDSLFKTISEENKIATERWKILYSTIRFKEKEIPIEDTLSLIAHFNNQLADEIIDVMQQGSFPVVIGGDHSIAVGTWNGVGCFLSQHNDKPLGLLWIDAHMDAHTEATTPSGAWHGMPLAALMGHGRKELAEIKRGEPIFRPENVCLIGCRSYEEGEAKLLEKLNVRIYFIQEVKDRGFQTVLKEAIEQVSRGTVGYGVSLDVDVVDPSEAPGTGSIEPDGLSAKELLEGLPLLRGDPHLKAFELVEFNPHLDEEGKTCQLCQEILSTVLGENFLEEVY